jgi:hypothetical protein
LSNAIAELRQDIGTIFRAVMSTSEGEGATALRQAQIQLSSMLLEALNKHRQHPKHAQEQQEVMQDLDRANAAAL